MSRKILLIISALFIVSACSDEPAGMNNTNVRENKPLDPYDQRNAERGSLSGEEGLQLTGRSSSQEAANASPLGVNSYLWRATLDTLAFMPLASADPFGGVIITDWYEDPKTPGERFKVNALILDKTLRADGVKITVFKQSALPKGGWKDQKVDATLARSLEDAILTRARQLKVASGK